MQATVKRVTPCFHAAALATGCKVTVTLQEGSTFDLRQNAALGGEVANIVLNKYSAIDYEWGIKSASTDSDFGHVTYALPALHPGFAIPTIVDDGNHTPGFTKSAATIKAHKACLDVSKALAATGVCVLIDDDFFSKRRPAITFSYKLGTVFALLSIAFAPFVSASRIPMEARQVGSCFKCWKTMNNAEFGTFALAQSDYTPTEGSTIDGEGTIGC